MALTNVTREIRHQEKVAGVLHALQELAWERYSRQNGSGEEENNYEPEVLEADFEAAMRRYYRCKMHVEHRYANDTTVVASSRVQPDEVSIERRVH